MDELVDILVPPRFDQNGATKRLTDAIRDGDWLGAMNFWLVRPGPALVYQERGPGNWEAGKLDCSAAGYYLTSESGLDGLREAEEELGWRPPRESTFIVGRHLSVSVDSSRRERRSVITVLMAFNTMPITELKPDPGEVSAVYDIPISDVLKVFGERDAVIVANGIRSDGRTAERSVRATDFTYVFGGYHRRIAQIAQHFPAGGYDKSVEDGP